MPDSRFPKETLLSSTRLHRMTETMTTLRCPGCGAPASPDDGACGYCHAALTAVACPSCFAPVFRDTKHCPRCGVRTARESLGDWSALSCPRCTGRFAPVRVGDVELLECGDCGGAWMRPGPFERICAEREAQAAVLARPLSETRTAGGAPEKIRYLPCPQCSKHMNRVNFARYSGVIMDACKEHGTFFDRDELRRIVSFIREGGLDRARDRERERLVEEQQRLHRARLDLQQEHRKAQPHYLNERRKEGALEGFLVELFGLGF
jgi:Zn-finger nucleic acid-binding protein